MMRDVRWLRLELEGFGLWRGATRFLFPECFGVLDLPNERGKSTLVAGIRAVLFGLPAESDPAVRGTARYRSWGHEGTFRGALDLRVDDQTIRIRREFTSHKTTVERLGDEERVREVLFDQNANPSGRTHEKTKYRSCLAGLLGDVVDEDLKGNLFEATFLIEQPVLPAREFNDALQSLVSGVGRVGGNEARARLFEDVKALTRATGDLEIVAPGAKRPTNQRSDGEIETLEVEIADLETRAARAADGFDRRRTIEEEMVRAETVFEAARSAEEHARDDLGRLEGYRQAARSLEAAREAHAELAGILERYDGEVKASAEAMEETHRLHPDLDDALSGLEAEIEAAIGLERDLGNAREEILRRKGQLADGRIDPEDSPWSRLASRGGGDPVAWIARVRTSADRWARLGARLHEIGAEGAACTTERERLLAVAVLPDDLQAALANPDATLREIEEKEEALRREDDSRAFLAEEIERREAEFERRYAPLEGIDPERFLVALEERAQRHRTLARLEETAAPLREEIASRPSGRRWLPGVLAGLVSGAAVATVARLLDAPSVLAAAAGIAAFLVALLLVARAPRAIRRGRAALVACEREIAELRARLRSEFLPSIPGLPDDATAVERAHEIFRQREADAEAIARTERAMSGSDGPKAAEEAVSSLRERRDRLAKQAQEIEAATGMAAPDAVAGLRALRERQHALASSIERAWEEIGEADSAAVPESDLRAVPISLLGPQWSALIEALQILPIEAETIGGLEEALAVIPAAEWERLETSARAHVGAIAARGNLGAELRRYEERAREIETRLEAARASIGEARLLASEGSLAGLRTRLRRRDELLAAAHAAEGRAAQLLAAARGGPYADRSALARALAEEDETRRDARSACEKAAAESEIVRSYERMEPAERDRTHREMESGAGTALQALENARAALAEARARSEAWRPTEGLNLAEAERDIAERRRTLETLRHRRDVLVKAWKLLGESIDTFRSAHRETLQEGLDGRFRVITLREGRTIRLDAGLRVEIHESGSVSSESQLSQGAQDQLAFCLRLAVADLIAGETRLPLILDDPFVHSDAERLARIRETLEETARERQVLLLTQDSRLRDWGEPIRMEP